MSPRLHTDSEAQGEGGFARRLSPLIAALGVTAVPDLLIRYQGRLGLTSNELVYLLNVLSHRRQGNRWPFAAASEIALRTGAGERSVRDWRASVVRKGYLVLRPRGNSGSEGGGRLADEHDLSPLFAALEALALEETLPQTTDQMHRGVPEPRYFRGTAGVPQRPPAESRRLQTQRAHPERENLAAFGREGWGTSMQLSARSTLPEPAGSTMPVPAEEAEDVKQKVLTSLTPQGAQGADGRQDGAVVRKPDDTFQPALPGTAAVALPPAGHDDPAERLLVAFYRGLDSDIASLTSRQRLAKLKLAQELVAAGATPSQAEAYARETNADRRRTAPVSLRSFAEERQAWLQRRGRPEASGPRLVDRTGQPPSWATDHAAERAMGEPRGVTAGALARTIVGGAS